MAAPNLFAFDSIGSVFALFDGQEVLVHGGADETPKWKKHLGGELTGLDAGGDAVITLERSGKLTFWHNEDGAELETIDLGAEALALTATRNGSTCAVVIDGAILIAARGIATRRIEAPGATAAAWSRDGARLAVGDATGAVRIVATAGETVCAVQIEEPVSSLCYSPAGFWIATGGDRIFRIDEGGASPEQITHAGGYAPDCVSASTDGSMLALRLSETMVLALALPSRDTVVQLGYLDRKVAGVAFGPERLLGVGLLGGDGNIVDITEKQLRRSDTFPGRAHNRWMVSTTIKPELLPPAPPRAARQGAAPAAMARPSASPGGLPLMGWVGILIGIIAFAAALSMCR